MLERPATVRLGKDVFALEVAHTEVARQRGLSYRAGLRPGTGMLFAFPAPQRPCFWMKDMHFAIAIVWLDAQHRIVKIEDHVPPDSYPLLYCADVAVQYVLELPAGSAGASYLELGQRVSLENR